MLSKLLRNIGWRRLRAFATPAFFDVMSARELLARAREVRLTKHDEAYRAALQARSRSIRELPLSVELPGQGAPARDDLGEGDTPDAARIVTLYFHQLFSRGPTLLDLRHQAFESQVDELRWNPAPWVCEFRDDFLPHLRDIYRGFYEGDDEQFLAGLRALDLENASDLFRAQFGEDQSGQEFNVADFVDTFTQVFVRCRDTGVKLHADFLPLGVYLASLYDCLDGKGVRVDVRACFERATSQPESAAAETRKESGIHG